MADMQNYTDDNIIIESLINTYSIQTNEYKLYWGNLNKTGELYQWQYSDCDFLL